MAGRRYRETRSARFPLGLPDRSDATVLEAFSDAWLLIEHSFGGARLAGVAEDLRRRPGMAEPGASPTGARERLTRWSVSR